MAAHPPVDRSRLQVRPLGEGDEQLIEGFSCGDGEDDRDLNEFLLRDASELQNLNVISVYLAIHDDAELIGYVALLTDAIRLKTSERKPLGLPHQSHPVVPAIKVARLAVSKRFRDEYSGAGAYLMSFAKNIALGVADSVGCRVLTVDAYPHAVPFYERLGFKANKEASKAKPGSSNLSMRLDVFSA